MRKNKDLIAIAVALLLCWGCGEQSSSPALTGSTVYASYSGQSFSAGGVVLAPAGASLTTQPPLSIRFINQSAEISQEAFQSWADDINWQLSVDFNPRWATSASLQVYSGALDVSVPTVILQDATDDTLPGATYLTADGNVWVVRSLPHTKAALEAYSSHAVLNRARPDYLPGQSVEASDYSRMPAYGGAAVLADFDFPSKHGLPGVYFDCLGKPAYDLLHVLSYP